MKRRIKYDDCRPRARLKVRGHGLGPVWSHSSMQVAALMVGCFGGRLESDLRLWQGLAKKLCEAWCHHT